MESPKRKPKCRMFRLFRCFNANGVASPEPKKTDPLLTYIAVPERQMFPNVFSSAFTAAKGGEGDASHRKKTDRDKNNRKKSNNFLRRSLTAALSHTPLAKKIHKRKINNDSFSRENSTNSSNISSYSRSSRGFTPTSTSSLSTSTNLSTSSTGTMTSSSFCEPCLTRSLAMNNGTYRVVNQKQNDGGSRRWYCGSNMALSVLLITSILVLILWGRFCAIVYTSIGFFVVPNRRRRTCEETEFCSVGYKK